MEHTVPIDAVFITGPQGSGKGTQGKRLAEKLGFLFWDMGAILREIGKEKNELGEKVSAIDHGTLLSDEIIMEIARERLALVPVERGVVFDGIPRRLAQAEFLVGFLHEQGRRNLVTIFLDLPRETSIERLMLRAKKEGRTDDTPKGIETRFRYYDELMQPTIAYLKKQTTFVAIDGGQSIDLVTQNIVTTLGLNIRS